VELRAPQADDGLGHLHDSRCPTCWGEPYGVGPCREPSRCCKCQVRSRASSDTRAKGKPADRAEARRHRDLRRQWVNLTLAEHTDTTHGASRSLTSLAPSRSQTCSRPLEPLLTALGSPIWRPLAAHFGLLNDRLTTRTSPWRAKSPIVACVDVSRSFPSLTLPATQAIFDPREVALLAVRMSSGI
jgi:hypothetical protein